jgi:N-acetylglucosamine-6-phosphate deacetylase
MQAISAARIFDGDHFLYDSALLIMDGKIIDIVSRKDLPPNIAEVNHQDALLAPAYIDLQVNGGGGALFNNSPTKESFEKVGVGHASKGTTRHLATLVSDVPQVTHHLLEAILNYHQNLDSPVIGIHQEGPFFNPLKRGAHKANYIRKPEQADTQWLQTLAKIPNILTLAPEMVGNDFIRQWSDAGINISLGHSHATADEANSAQQSGAKLCTHLYNAMSGLQARDSGLIGASLENNQLACSIIVDGHHVDKIATELAFKSKPKGKLFFVSDAMATIGASQKSFQLYGETLTEKNNKLINDNGNLAGAAIGLSDAVKYAEKHFTWPLEEILRMASLYPAQQLNLAHKFGKLTSGHIADIVVLNKTFTPISTYRAGKVIYTE